jgi:DNA repair photolyase
MSLKKSVGNMYPWVTHTHSHLGGECPHKCVYCYVDNPRFGRPAKYQGPIRLIEAEFAVNYGSGKTIFIENCNDLFAEGIPDEFIRRILSHCRTWPENTYVFQTKNPARMRMTTWEPNAIFGTTLETNRGIPEISKAPRPQYRVAAMMGWKVRKFVTIEPVLDFDVDVLSEWIARVEPEFVNLGADSKAHHLPEPTIGKIMALVEKLKGYGIELREKHNLSRLKP